MARQWDKRGIIVSGEGKFEADQVAVGDNAQANSYVSSNSTDISEAERRHIWQLLGQLQEALVSERSLKERPVLLRTSREIADQLAGENPCKTSILSLVGRIMDYVPTESAIRSVANLLKIAITKAFTS